MEIKISLSRKKKTAEGYSWKEYSLKPEEYFDLDVLDEGEELNIESIPLYSQTIDYLYELEEGFEKKDILHTRLVLTWCSRTKVISEKFWNDGNNCLIERLDLYPDYYYNLVILGILIDDKYEETIRIEKSIGMETFAIATHSICDSKTEVALYTYSDEKYKL